jgi:predicted CXXCH cytochrome family protein
VEEPKVIDLMSNRRLMFLCVSLLLVFWTTMRFGIGWVEAERRADIRNTKHNLSASGTGTVKATSETEICVFCHTPHNATSGAVPLWNRKLSSQTYTKYNAAWSSSLDAEIVQGNIGDPAGSSKLCLACHDGSINIGSVNVLAGMARTQEQSIAGLANKMPAGADGYTRNLGTDLTNDHPISISFNDTLANRDGELRRPSDNTGVTFVTNQGYNDLIGVKGGGNRPILKLEETGSGAGLTAQVQCATCHDPHIRETDTSHGNQKFLRLNRFQRGAQPSSSGFSVANDIVCLACHDKNNGTGAWAFSAHANPAVANQTYKTGTTLTNREFPSGIKVWEASCLNCHDSHTAQGAKKLLREGVGGGKAAQEQVCFQCHQPSADSIVEGGTSGVPDIETDFTTTNNRRMPIANANEVHDVGGNFDDSAAGGPEADCTGAANKCGASLVERRSKLGVGNLGNRHAECTDCHNPHRVIRAQNGLPGTLSSSNTADTVTGRTTGGGAHKHTDATGYTHSNIISGVLRGSWGVEPTYSSANFHSLPSGYNVKRGDPGGNTGTLASAPYVTREYQICLKCHSDYGYSDNNLHVSAGGNRPTLGYTGGTPSTTNGLTMYTNQAKEFQAPAGHAADSDLINLGTEAGSADPNFNTKNHRSWHPVMAPTGRTAAARSVTATSAWRLPWSNGVGTQTMYCTDCHGSNVTSNTSVIPNSTGVWGPHGSGNNFILKGTWDNESSTGATTTLCLKCHNPTSSSAFSGGGRGNLHSYHIDKIGRIECTWCHVAVPHGWKNRSLLVNLNDVGEEAGQGAGSSKEVSINGNADYYTQQPYYLEAKLKIYSFGTSGSWAEGNCGSRNKASTSRINSTNGNSTNNTNPATGKDWMRNTCSSPP